MSAERLQLPEPAGTLWTRIREPLKRALGSRGAPTELKLGGWTVLAARWEHRRSHDIDIVVPEKTNLWTHGAALDDAMTALGADKYGYSPKHKQYRAAFTEGSTRQTLEIWPNDPEPRGAERTAEVDGGNEIVLATAQILKGKLERGEDALARDVIDVITAERLDPASLALRPFVPEDAEAVYAYRRDPGAMRFTRRSRPVPGGNQKNRRPRRDQRGDAVQRYVGDHLTTAINAKDWKHEHAQRRRT